MFQDICEQMKKKEDIYFRNKQEQIILVELVSGVTKYFYFIGQREKVVFDLQDSSFKFSLLSSTMGFKGFKQYIPIDNPIEQHNNYNANEQFIVSNIHSTAKNTSTFVSPTIR